MGTTRALGKTAGTSTAAKPRSKTPATSPNPKSKPSQSESPASAKTAPPKVPRLGSEATGQWPKGLASYNDGWFRRYGTCILAKLKSFCMEQSDSYVVNILGNKSIKFGKGVHLSEAFALQLVAEKTSVPVPKLDCGFKKGDITYIAMERISGATDMDKLWEKMSKADQQRIVTELKDYFEQLRQIPHPRPGTICTAAADDQPAYGFRTPHAEHGAGPFQNEEDFNSFLRSGKPDGQPEDLKALIEMPKKTRHDTCFTHGDAAPRNVMIRKDPEGEYHVAPLIDFEMSGFFPEYWEYVTAKVPVDGWGPQYWNTEVDKFLKQCPAELEMDRLRLQYFGPFDGNRGLLAVWVEWHVNTQVM